MVKNKIFFTFIILLSFITLSAKADKLDRVIEKLEEINSEHHLLEEALKEKYQQMLFQHIIFNTLDHLELLKYYNNLNAFHKRELVSGVKLTKDFLAKINANSDLTNLLDELHYLEFQTQNLQISLQNYAGSLAKLKAVQESLLLMMECKPKRDYIEPLEIYKFTSKAYDPIRMVANPIASLDDEGSYAWNPVDRIFQYDQWYLSTVHYFLMPVSTFIDFILFQNDENEKRAKARDLLNAILEKNNLMYQRMSADGVVLDEFEATCRKFTEVFHAKKNDISILSNLRNILGADSDSFKEFEAEIDAIKLKHQKAKENISNYQDMVDRSLNMAKQFYGVILQDLSNRADQVEELAFNRSLLETKNVILTKDEQQVDAATGSLLENVIAHDKVNSFREDFSGALFLRNDIFEDNLREVIR